MSRSMLHLLRHFGFDRRGRTAYMLNERSLLTPQQQYNNAVAEGFSPTPPATGSIVGTLSRTLAALTLGAAATVGGGGSAPAAPTITGLTLLADFNFGAEAAGAWPGANVAPIAGSVTGARAAVGGGAPIIGTVSGTRRGLITDGVDDWVSITGLLASLLPTNPDVEFLFFCVGNRMDGAAGAGYLDISRGTQSGNLILNRYSVRSNTTDVIISRADGANTANATIGTGAAGAAGAARRIGVRHSLNGDQISRGMVNGGTKVSTAARSVTSSGGAWARIAIGARMENGDGTTMSNFSPVGIERMLFYIASSANNANDAALNTIESAFASYYT